MPTWVNPLVTDEQLDRYLTGTEDELAYDLGEVLVRRSGKQHDFVGFVTCGFLRALSARALADGEARKLWEECQKQRTAVMDFGLPQPDFEEDIFFDFCHRLCTIEPNLSKAPLHYVTNEIVLIAGYLMKRLPSYAKP